PTTRSPTPRANAISVVSAVRQTTRRGYGAGGEPYTEASYHPPATRPDAATRGAPARPLARPARARRLRATAAPTGRCAVPARPGRHSAATAGAGDSA